MPRKLITLLFALMATAGALLLTPKPSEAAHCNGFLVCCPDTGQCYCCIRPCPIQCP